MRRQALTGRGVIILLLILQFIPLVLFPAESFSPKTQEWWLPVLLAVMVIIADIQLIIRRSPAQWPWYLIAFAQGFNIISRLMMVWPHATKTVEKVTVANGPYLVLTAIALALSAFMLWYIELPEVQTGLLRKA